MLAISCIGVLRGHTVVTITGSRIVETEFEWNDDGDVGKGGASANDVVCYRIVLDIND